MSKWSFFLLTLLCSGCVSIESYPDSWEPIVEGKSTCADISGTYSESGETPSGERTISLKNRLLDNPPPSLKPTRVVINLSQDGSLLQFKFLDQDVSLHEQELRLADNEFSCEKGVLTLSKTEGINREGVLALQSGSIQLYRVNSMLVAKSSSGGVGVMLLIPVVGYGTYYARFPSVD